MREISIIEKESTKANLCKPCKDLQGASEASNFAKNGGRMKRDKLTVPLMERAEHGNQNLNGTCVNGRSRELLLEIRELLNVFAPAGDD